MNLIKAIAVTSFAFIFIGVTGCTSFNPLSNLGFQESNQTQSGPDPVLNTDDIEKINIVELFDVNTKQSIVEKTVENNQTIEEAFQKLTTEISKLKDADKIQRRNEIQDRIIAASNQRCGSYKTWLKQFDSETNLKLGGLATGFATAGAIFSAESTIRAASGIAAFFSGLRAEVNESYFHNQTINIITNGIELRRSEILKTIYDTRQSASVANYTVWRAVADAVFYHDHCSLVAGLEKASEAVAIARTYDLGVEKVNAATSKKDTTQAADQSNTSAEATE